MSDDEQPTEPFNVQDILDAIRKENDCHGFEPPHEQRGGGILPICYRCGQMTLPPLWVCSEDYCPMRPIG